MGDPSPAIRRVRWFPRLGVPSLYLASFIGTPAAIAVAVVQPFPAPEAAYGAAIFVAALPIYFMTVAGAGATGHRTYSWWGLRAQVWLHLGGAVRPAVQHLRERPQGRHQQE